MRLLAVLSCLAVCGPAMAAEKIVYGPPAAWVTNAPINAPPPAVMPDVQSNPPLKFLLSDSQVRFTPGDVTEYVAFRVRIAAPEGLPIGSFAREWDPATDTLTVHHLRIERDGQVIDVLQSQKFEILRRERSLEQSMLDGRLTATLQIADLRVGDILDVAMSVTRAQPVLAARNSSTAFYGPSTPIDKARVRMIWDKTAPARWRVGSGLPRPTVTETATSGEFLFEAADIVGPTRPESAPQRFSFEGAIQASQAESWTDISRAFLPAYQRASQLEANSPLKAEADKIRKAAATPTERASLALKLVQDQIRYVAITMNAQGYTPAQADETWRRRFGDCKGKTALLLALLKELDIEATPALVNSSGSEALNTLLPKADSFDHVIVRATIDGKPYWLDGTRTGDGPVEAQIKPWFGWALPLTAQGSELERLRSDRLERPSTQYTLRLDGSDGLNKDTPVELEVILRDRNAGARARAMAAAPKAQLERSLISRYDGLYTGLRFTDVTWRYDQSQSRLVLNLKGAGVSESSEADGVSRYEVPGSTLVPPDLKLRPKTQDQTAPYDVDDTDYTRRVTIITLPKDGKTYNLSGGATYEVIGGVLRTRWAGRTGNQVVMVRSLRGVVEELPAEQMAMDSEAARKMRANVIVLNGRTPAKPTRGKTPEPPRDNTGLFPDSYYAVDLKRRAIVAALDPAKRDALVLFATQLNTLGSKRDYAGILKALDENKLDLTPLSEYAARERAHALRELGREAEALQVLDETIALAPTANLLGDRAILHSRARPRRATEAEADRKAALTLDPDNLFALRTSVAGAEARSDLAALVSLRRNISRLQPDAPTEWLALADAEAAAGHPVEAEQALRDAAEAGAIGEPLLSTKAKVMIRQKRNDEAMALLDAAVAAQPGDSLTLNNVCYGRATANLQLLKALSECERSVSLDPNAANTDSLAFVKLRLGRSADAVADYNKALRQNPRSAESLYGRGIARLRTGQTQAGQSDLAAAAQISPDVAKQFDSYGVTP